MTAERIEETRIDETLIDKTPKITQNHGVENEAYVNDENNNETTAVDNQARVEHHFDFLKNSFLENFGKN